VRGFEEAWSGVGPSPASGGRMLRLSPVDARPGFFEFVRLTPHFAQDDRDLNEFAMARI
jgi:hypothetical protein